MRRLRPDEEHDHDEHGHDEHDLECQGSKDFHTQGGPQQQSARGARQCFRVRARV